MSEFIHKISQKIIKFFKNKEYVTLFILTCGLASNSAFLNYQKGSSIPSSLVVYNYPRVVLAIYFVLSVIFFGALFFFNDKISIKSAVKRIVLVYLPSELILLFNINRVSCVKGISSCNIINNLLPLLTPIIFILIGYLIIKFRKREREDKFSFKKWIKSQNKYAIAIILIVFCLNLTFGLYHLSKMAAVDEALWTFDRIPKFWNNVLDGEWYKTRISDKPGITVALISGTGLLFLDPKEYKSISWQGNIYGPGKNIEDMNFALRFPILLFNALSLFVFYFFIRKLLGEKTAVFTVTLIGLSPILLGISTIINPDSLLWVFLPLSLVSYFVYKKEDKNAYLYWSGIFMGLALLTKYVANILFVFFFLAIFLEYIFNKEKYPSISAYLKRSIIDYFILIFFSLLTFMVLLPASWTEISKVLDGTILSKAFQKVWPAFLITIALIILDISFIKEKISGTILNFLSKYKRTVFILFVSVFLILILAALANTYLGMKWYDFESILASPKSSFSYGGFLGLILANFYSLIFGISPLAFLAVIFLLLTVIFSKKSFIRNGYFIFSLIIFILIYYFASTIQTVSATVRYQIVIYPLALIIAAIALNKLTEFKKIKKYIPDITSFLVLVIISVYSLYLIKPFYFSYASALLPKQYVLNLKDMGDGSYEAAQYLNNLPNAADLRIWTDKKGVCTFFLGNYCSSSIDKTTQGQYFDYFVLSAGRESRTSKLVIARVNGGNTKIIRLDKLYESENVDWKLEIGGRPNNFVKIIGSDKT